MKNWFIHNSTVKYGWNKLHLANKRHQSIFFSLVFVMKDFRIRNIFAKECGQVLLLQFGVGWWILVMCRTGLDILTFLDLHHSHSRYKAVKSANSARTFVFLLGNSSKSIFLTALKVLIFGKCYKFNKLLWNGKIIRSTQKCKVKIRLNVSGQLRGCVNSLLKSED